MSDKIVNFYDKLGIKGSALPKTWSKHHMYNKLEEPLIFLVLFKGTLSL